MRFRLTLILWILVSGLHAQGLIFNDDAYVQAPTKKEEYTGVKGEALRNIFKVDLKPYCPTVREQGKISSCVGWSVGYAAMTIEKAVANGWEGDQRTIDDHAFSAMYLYNQVKLGDCSFGAELNHAFGLLKEKGNVLYRDFAVGNNCDTLPASALAHKARLNRVKDFATLFKPDDKDDVKVERVKRTLAQMKPVVIGMIVLENFLSLKSADHVWYPNVGKTDVFGGHAMVVIGYDDGRKAFEVMNSWGKGWANGGFVWIRYEDFSRYCKYAYQLVVENTELGTNTLHGSIQILKPVLKYTAEGQTRADFSPLWLAGADDYFLLADAAVSLPLEFQLVAEGFRKGSYLYVISFDRNLRPSIHWPANGSLRTKPAAPDNTAVIASPHDVIRVPGKYKVFRMAEAGVEYLCIISSARPIHNLAERCASISLMKGELPQRIKQVFKSVSIGDTDAQKTDRIDFHTSATHKDVASILLKFDLQK